MPPDDALTRQTRLITALRAAARWPAAAGPVEVIETHVSWVLLVGGHACKFKKALNLGFLDYSTLERRRFFCEEELRLNRRTAPEIYLDVLPIAGTVDDPQPGGTGEPVEFAVRMRRFDQAALLDSKLAAGTLTAAHIDDAVRAAAALHAIAERAAPDSPYGEPATVYHPVSQNYAQIRPLLDSPAQAEVLAPHAAWAEARFAALSALMAARKAGGFVRECHGDLHLGNLAEVDGRVLAFDGIEFNPELRFIDVMSELAFLAMDLEARGQWGLARRAVNGYLERTGDYAGLALLDFYKHYRAMVRAKVTAIRRRQPGIDVAERLALTARFGDYLALASHYLPTRRPALLLTCGLSGTGKSVLAAALAEGLDNTVRLRSDVERKRLFGLGAQADSRSLVGAGIYTAEASARTYARLGELAKHAIDGGYTAVVDATFLERARREDFRAMACAWGVPFLVLYLTAPEQVLHERIVARHTARQDASEADLAVLAHQQRRMAAPQGDELEHTLVIDAGRDWQPARAVQQVQTRLEAGACR
ncbi:MAG: AAA family ATPase [Thiohalomonadaceae bacterium]